MTKEENYFRAADFRNPRWIPVRVSLMPATWAKYRQALQEIVLDLPFIFDDCEKGSADFNAFSGT